MKKEITMNLKDLKIILKRKLFGWPKNNWGRIASELPEYQSTPQPPMDWKNFKMTNGSDVDHSKEKV